MRAVSSWNVEHLAYPIDLGCRPRTQGELNELKAYADALEVDVIGLQEVASAQAVELLFPSKDWTVIMSERPDTEGYTCRDNGNNSTQQKVAFAVRKGLTVESVEQLDDFGLDNPGLRYGLSIDVSISPDLPSVSILNLHLKSGCFVDNHVRADSDSCQTFSKQVPVLDACIDSK